MGVDQAGHQDEHRPDRELLHPPLASTGTRSLPHECDHRKQSLRRHQLAVARPVEPCGREGSLLNSGRALGVFQLGGVLVFVCFEETVLLADLLLNLFCHTINRSVHIAFNVLGEQIRAAHGKPHRTAELSFRHTGVIMFQGDPRINGPWIKVIQLLNAFYDMGFEGFC